MTRKIDFGAYFEKLDQENKVAEESAAKKAKFKTENKEERKNSEKIEPVFGNEEKANPHLFDNLKLNR